MALRSRDPARSSNPTCGHGELAPWPFTDAATTRQPGMWQGRSALRPEPFKVEGPSKAQRRTCVHIGPCVW